jgi:hypothetical protein
VFVTTNAAGTKTMEIMVMPKNVIVNKDTVEFIEQLESRGYSIVAYSYYESMRNKRSVGSVDNYFQKTVTNQ